ncbi:MAG: hypothetical protein LBR66_02470 [Candidatus Symbiothrix sp.]|jgi:hypothetical protein|nr:hypothetical protein [Candidatus Symbiothrix sp.]
MKNLLYIFIILFFVSCEKKCHLPEQTIGTGEILSDGLIPFIDELNYNDDVLKQYIYTINVVQCGNCESRDASMNWVLVPKIPDDYTVRFVVENNKFTYLYNS